MLCAESRRSTNIPHLAQAPRITVEDDLATEDGADTHHEYIGGELYTMTGAGRQHGMFVGNINASLRPLLRGKPCQLVSNDTRFRLRIAG